MSKKFLFLFLMVVFCLCSSVQATWYWTNAAGDQKWTNGGNWDTGYPIAPDDLTDLAWSLDTIDAIPPTLVETGDAALADDCFVGNNTGKFGHIIMTGGTCTSNSKFTVGQFGTGVVDCNGTAALTETTYDVVLGNASSSHGTLNVSGNATVTAQRHFNVGQAGTGILNVSDNAAIYVIQYDIQIADQAGGNGTLNMSGGSLNPARNLKVGGGGGSGTAVMNMTGGTANVPADLMIPETAGIDATLNLDGGIINAQNLSMKTGGLLNITDGTLILDGDVAAAIGDLVDAGLITAYNGSSEVLVDYNQTISNKTTITAANPYYASNLSPVGLEPNLATTLTWTPGLDIELHRVYFSTNEDDVINRLPAADHGYQDPGYDPVPGDLEQGQTYYWCVDEVHPVSGQTYSGDVVSFVTAGLIIENDIYSVAILGDLGLVVTEKSSGAYREFSPEFTVIYSTFQPSLTPEYMQYATWATGQNPFNTGTNYVVQATNVDVVDGDIVWTFPTQSKFDLQAWVDLSTDYDEPALFYTITAKTDGWFMTAYTGAPEANPATMEMLPQPTMWGSKHINPPDGGSVIFPDEPKSTPEHAAPMPAVAIRDNGITCAVVANPDFVTFWVPNYKRHEFALGIRNPAGNAQPIIFAPQMGAQYGAGEWGESTPTDKDCYLAVGESFSFSQLWVVDDAEWKDVYRGIAQDIYNVRDQRDNSGPGSMNKLLGNLRDYALCGYNTGHAVNDGPNYDANGNRTYDFFDPDYTNYNMWDEEQKCNEYFVDQHASFKILNGLYAINAAIVMDDEELFLHRALPQVEYALSREKMGFHPYNYNYNNMMKFNNNMNGPFMDGIDLGHLYWMTGGRTEAFKTYSLEKGHTNAYTLFYESLEWYRLWGDSDELDYAINGAYYTLNNPYRIYDFQKFLEIYDETGDPNFLEEAGRYAYNFATTLNTSPRVPDANIVVDVNNEVPIHHHTYPRHVSWGFPPPEPMYAPEQEVPAWRPAFTGMQPMTYRAFTFSEFPAPLLRLSGDLDDDFLKSLARWAAVGRWANWPGQQFSTIDHSLGYEQDDFPMHPLQGMTFTSAHPWHHYMYFFFAIDFMVNDVITKSDGNVDFPRRNVADKGAGGRENIWGHKSGTFYGDDNVTLWLPRNLLTISTEQINYIAGYGNGNLYLALSNQSFDALSNVSLTLNTDRVDFGSAHPVRVWEENVQQSDKTLSNGTVTVDVAASGLTVLVIENVEAKTGKVHTEIFSKPQYTLAPDSLSRTTELFGEMVGMIISFGPELTEAYCYTDTKASFHEDGDTNYVTMHYSLDGGPWQQTTDTIFPYEFSTWIDPDVSEFSFYFEKVDDLGRYIISATQTLNARKIGSISGTVQDLDGNPIQGAQVDCTDSAPVTTDANGYYLIENVVSGSKTLTASKSGYEFIPTQRSVDLQLGSIDHADWIGKEGTLEVLDYLRILASHWLRDDTVDSQGVPLCECAPIADYNGDCKVNLVDFALMFSN